MLRKLRRPPRRFVRASFMLASGPRSFFCPVGIAKMPNTKRTAKTTPGRDTHRGAPQRLRILESDSSSSDEEDFVDRVRQSSTDTSRAGVRPTLPPQQQRTPTPTVVPNSYATSPTDARPPTPPTAATPPPGDMNDAISAAQGPPPYSPSSPGEVGDLQRKSYRLNWRNSTGRTRNFTVGFCRIFLLLQMTC